MPDPIVIQQTDGGGISALWVALGGLVVAAATWFLGRWQARRQGAARERRRQERRDIAAEDEKARLDRHERRQEAQRQPEIPDPSETSEAILDELRRRREGSQ